MHDASEDMLTVRRFASGEREALGDLATRHERAMLGMARGLLGGSAALAEEAVQDAWVRVINAAGRFRGTSAVRTWLLRIVINRCRDIARRERLGKGAAAARNADDASPTVCAANGEVGALVAPLLAALPNEQREAVVLCVGMSLTHAQAAEVLNVAVGTVKSRVRLGMARLRARVPDAGGDA